MKCSGKETEEKKNHSKLHGDLLSLALGKQRMNLLLSNFGLTTTATCYTNTRSNTSGSLELKETQKVKYTIPTGPEVSAPHP